MFSGITTGLFRVVSTNYLNDLLDYSVMLSSSLMQNLKIGDSIAVDGVCQSVVEVAGNQVSFQAISETLDKTTLRSLSPGKMVSIERSLRFGDEIGGHEVSGHVFGTGIVSQILETHSNVTLVIHCDVEWMKYIIHKGFIAIDGSSLTVGETDTDRGLFAIHLIPETLRMTNFKNKNINDKVNIEFDYKTKIIVDTVLGYVGKLGRN